MSIRSRCCIHASVASNSCGSPRRVLSASERAAPAGPEGPQPPRPRDPQSGRPFLLYLAIGIDCDGAKNVLGLWVGPSTCESSKFWLTVLSELKSRGAADVCIVCCDGLTGLPDAITVVWPQATVQLCVVCP